jgi:hypothetical protein
MSVARFEDTASLDDRALHTLLAAGRPEQRVWAAWQIALRVGAMPHIVGHVVGEPSAGVRRALLAVLAGHGELDVLVALARHDPAIAVRSHASQLVAALAAQGAIASAVVTEAYAAGPTEIRVAILRGLPAGGPAPLSALVDAALERGDPAEQLEAFDVALGDARPAVVDAALRWLRLRPAEVTAEAWLRVQRRPAAHIVALLRGESPVLRARAVQALVAVPIAELAELFGAEPEVFHMLRERHDLAAAPPELLARAILAGLAGRFVRVLTAQLGALRVAPAALAARLPVLREHVRARLAAIHREEPLGPDEREAELGQAWAYRYSELLEKMERLLRVVARTTSTTP